MSPPVTVELLNLPPYQWRVFDKEYSSGKLYDVSDANIPASMAIDQLADKVRISDKEILSTTTDNSVFKVINGHISLDPLHFETVNPGGLSVTTVTSASNVYVAMEPSAMAIPTGIKTGYIVSPSKNMVYSNQNKVTYPMSIRWNFSDIIGYDSRRISYIFVRASVEVAELDLGKFNEKKLDAMDFGGGIYMDLFGMDAYGVAISASQWCPLYTEGYLTGRTFIVPVNPHYQTNMRFMVRGCRNWSIELIGYISGA